MYQLKKNRTLQVSQLFIALFTFMVPLVVVTPAFAQTTNFMTGCLAKSGVLNSIASGSSPLAPCKSSSLTASFNLVTLIAGTGLTGGGQFGAITLAADTNYLQRRVTGTCPSGQFITGINFDGTVTCQADSIYTAGPG